MNVSYIPSTEKGPKKEMKISFLVLVLFGLSKKYFFEVVMEMMHIPSGDNDDDAEDDEAGASPLAGNCGGADVEIFRSIRGSAHLSFSSFSFSSAFSYISNFSQSPHVPILLLNAINSPSWSPSLSCGQADFLVSNPCDIDLSKSSPGQDGILAPQKRFPDPQFLVPNPSFSTFVDSGHWTASA